MKGLLKQSEVFIPTLSFVVVFGWVLSFPYEGPILYAFADQLGFDFTSANMATVFFHAIGLFLGLFIARHAVQAQKRLLMILVSVFVLSSIIPIVSNTILLFLLPIISLIAGLGISIHGRLIKAFIQKEDRNTYVMLVLVVGNGILILADLLASNIGPLPGYLFVQVVLLGAIYAVYKLKVRDESLGTDATKDYVSVKQYLFFYSFILIITINSGLMFQVIYPYFRTNTFITSLYTNVPYILAIILLWRIKMNKHYFLYVGLFLWTVTFILFSFVSDTPWAFIAVSTPMLFAAGIFDMFWWSIMANNLENVKNPSSLLGIGLSLNVLGVWLGGLLGNFMVDMGADHMVIAFVGIGVTVVCMLLIMPLNITLIHNTRYKEFLMDEQWFMEQVSANEVEKQAVVGKPKEVLSSREYEIFLMLMKGKKNQDISEELFISLNTIKTHNRNVYKKLEVGNKSELIEKFGVKET